MANDSILIQVQLGSPTKANINAVTRQIQNSLSNVSANVQIQNGRQAAQTLQNVKKGADGASRSMNSFGEAIGLSARRFLAFTSAVAVVGRLTSAISQATREAIKFEREFVKLAQVFDTDVKALGRLQNSISDLAQEFGLSANVIAKTSVVLAQSGLNAKETEKAMRTLAKTTLAATFDNIASSAEGAVAIMAQFETEASQLEAQLGAINAVSKRFAVESGDIIEAVRRAGGAFKAAGGDLNDFIALFTAVRSTTRESAETIATGFRTIFARIQRPKTIEFFRELNIELTDGRGNFIGAFEAVRRLSDGLRKAGIEAGSLRFAEVVEQLGGIRQVSRVIPLLGQFAKAERARQTAQEGAASLDRDAAKAQETLAQAFARTTENFRALIREITQTGTFQAFVKIALSMANAFIEAARAIKPLIPLIAALAAIKLGGLLSGALKKGFSGAGGTGGLGQGFNRGGLVPGTGNSDTVPAVLTPGEFVIRKSAVQAFGADRLAGINKYAKGGAVASVDLKKTIDGDSLGINFTPAEEPYYTSSRLVGADTFEMSEKPGTKNRFLAEEGKKVTDQWARSLSSKQLTDKFKKANKYDNFGRPMFEAPDLIKFLRANPATYRGKKASLLTGKFEDRKMANGGPVSVRDAVARYSSNSAEVNTGQTDRRTNKLRDELDSIMGQDEVPAVLFSGIGQTRKKLIEDQIGGPINQEAIGKTFSLPGFLSTSSNSAIAGRFVNKSTGGKGGIGYILEITTKGRGINVSGGEEAHYEKESILPRNSKFQINSVGLSRHGFNVGVKELAKGGPAGTDTVPALLTPGEFVINKKSAEAFGYNGLEKINKYASGGPVGVQRFNTGGGVGVNRSELYLKQILDQLKTMESVGGSGGDFQKETDNNTDSIKENTKERQGLTSAVVESFGAQQQFALKLGTAVGGLALFSQSLGTESALKFSDLLVQTGVKFSVFQGTLGLGQKAALKLAGSFEKLGLSSPKESFETLKSKTKEAGNSLREMFKSKAAKKTEKTLGEIRKGGAAAKSTIDMKPDEKQVEVTKLNGAILMTIGDVLEEIKNQIESIISNMSGKDDGKEKFKMPSMAKKPDVYGLESVKQEAARLADKAGTYALQPPETGSPLLDETESDRKYRRTGQAQDRNNPRSRQVSRTPKRGRGSRAAKGGRGAGRALKGLGKLGSVAKVATAAIGALGGVAKIATAAVGLYASALSTIAAQEAKIAEERKENAIKEGNVQEAVAQQQEQTAKEFKSQAVSVGASAGGAIGTVVGALLIPILGPLGPMVGGLIGSIGGLIAGLSIGRETMYVFADAARGAMAFFIDVLNGIANGINDYFLTPLSDAINYIYSWVTDEELDVNLEIPKVSDEITAMLTNMIPDPELTDRLERAQVAHEAGLVKYTRTQEAATKAVESSLKAFELAGDAATKVSLLGDAMDQASTAFMGFETSGEGGGAFSLNSNVISRQDIEAKRREVADKREAESKGARAKDGDIVGQVEANAELHRATEEAAKQLAHMEEKAKIQNEQIDKGIQAYDDIFAAARDANLLSESIAKVNKGQKLQIDAAGVITRQSIKDGSALHKQLMARIAAGATEKQALAAMTVQIFGVTGALGNLKDATQKAYETIGGELKTLAFGTDEQQAASAQKVMASAAVASGQVKINDLSGAAKEGALSFLPALANAGISEFGGGNILDSLTANVADTIPGFDQIGDAAAERVRKSGGGPEQQAAAKKEEQDRLVKAMFGIDDTAQKQLEAAQESVKQLTAINEKTVSDKKENTDPADPKQGENGKKAEGEEGGKKAPENALQIQELPKPPEQVQASVLDEAKKQTVLLAAILAKPVAGGVAGAQGSLAKDVNAAYDTAKSAASTAISYSPLGVVRNTLGLGEDDGSGMRIGDLFGGEGEKKRMARIKREKAGEDLQARNREKYGQPAGAKVPTLAGAGGVDQKQVQNIIASLGKGSDMNSVGAGAITSPDLIEAANKIKEASEIFPKEIQMTLGDTSVNVNINGAEVLNAIMPEVKSLVMGSVVNELVNFEKTKDQNSSPGSYANNKKAEQYAV